MQETTDRNSQSSWMENLESIKMKLKNKWRQLTDSDLDNTKDQKSLTRLMENKCGITHSEAESQINELLNDADVPPEKPAPTQVTIEEDLPPESRLY